MAACEKCWRDAGSNPYEYRRLLDVRKEHLCTPEEQAGLNAEECPVCKRKTVHPYAQVCMVPECPWSEKET
jgi:hypothetical protein